MTTTEATTDLWTSDFPGLHGRALELARQVPEADARKFSEHWAEFFAASIELAGTAPVDPSPESVLDTYPLRSRGSYFFTSEDSISEDADYEFEDGVIYAALHTRQGGGNRECYCDGSDEFHEDGCLALNNEILVDHPNYIFDYDDSFDYTYATFVYRTELTADDLATIKAQVVEANGVRLLNSQIAEINDGTRTPWSILAANGPVNLPNELRTAKQLLLSAVGSFDADALALAEAIVAIGAKIVSREVVDLGETLGAMDSRELQRQLKIQDYRSGMAIDKLKSASESNGKLIGFKAMAAEAATLPEGSVLREHLLGDRGQGSYMAKEKQGRRNVEVRKVYERGSLLGKEVESAKNNADYHIQSAKESLAPIEIRRDELLELKQKISELEHAVVELEAASWAAGWPVVGGKGLPAQHGESA